MRETQTKTIDGHNYQVQMLPGTKSWKMMLRLAKMIGPSLGKVIDGAGGDLNKLMASGISSSFISEAIAMLTSRLDEGEVELIVQQLSECTLVDNKPLKPVFDLHFQGDPIGVVKWLAFSIQANFGPFSSVLANVGQQDKGEKTRPA